jgi:hypothetical protein
MEAVAVQLTKQLTSVLLLPIFINAFNITLHKIHVER